MKSMQSKYLANFIIINLRYSLTELIPQSKLEILLNL